MLSLVLVIVNAIIEIGYNMIGSFKESLNIAISALNVWIVIVLIDIFTNYSNEDTIYVKFKT